MIYEALGLNPVELIAGVEMFDDELKTGIAKYMNRIDEKVFVSGMFKDEEGNEFYLNLADYQVVTGEKNGSDKWIPYTEYYNVEGPSEEEIKAHEEKKLPESPYDPKKVYINEGHYIFVIPVEILEIAGKPMSFDVIQNIKKGWVGFRFFDDPKEGGFDIPEIIYNGEWKGIRVRGGEYGSQLCKDMGIRTTWDPVEIEPVYYADHRSMVLFLDRAKIVNVNIDHPKFLLPVWQYEEDLAEFEPQRD